MIPMLFFCYIVFLFLFTLFSYGFIDSNLSYLQSFYTGFSHQERAITTVIYFLSIVLFFAFYLLFIYFYKRKKIPDRRIISLIGITAVILFSAYPVMLSYDIFNYIATAKVLYFYQENPYIVMPIEFLHDPLLDFTRASNKTALYGPSWLLLTGIPYVFGSGNFLVTLFAFKAMIVFFYLGALYFVWKITKSLLPVLLIGLNPLFVIESFVSGHNDIVMMFFVLGAYYFLMKKKIILAVALLTLSVLIKYASLFLLPLFLFILWQVYRKKKVDFEKMFFFSGISMLAIFLLSPIREEMYPWYAIWFLVFSFMIYERKNIFIFSLTLSFSLMFRYIPYMVTGNYFGSTPIVKAALTIIPLFVVGVVLLVKHKSWSKKIFR